MCDSCSYTAFYRLDHTTEVSHIIAINTWFVVLHSQICGMYGGMEKPFAGIGIKHTIPLYKCIKKNYSQKYCFKRN